MDSQSPARFDEIYQAYFKNVHAYCRRRVNADHVDDAASETFLTAWRKIDSAPDGSDVLPWLYRVAYGVITNQWRTWGRQQRLRVKLFGTTTEPVLIPDEVIIRRQEAQQIVQALTNLRPQDREILQLAVWEELSGEEIAIALDISHESARQRLTRARRQLAAEYNRLETRGRTRPSSPAQEGSP